MVITEEELRIILTSTGGDKVAAEMLRLDKSVKKLKNSFSKGAIGADEFVSRVKPLYEKINILRSSVAGIQMNKFNRALRVAQGAMLNFGLSILFAGMQIQKTFLSIARSAIDSFMKISAGQTPAGQAITALAAGFEFLKYSIGDAIGTALLPLLPIFLDIIDSVSEWVSQNPELTAQIILLGAALGTLMFIGGQILLFLNGLLGVITAMGLTAPGAISALLGSLSGLLVPIGLLILAIVLLWKAWETNFNGIQELVKNFVDNFLKLIDSLVGDATQIITGFLKIIDGIFKGDTKMIMDGIIMIVKGAVAALLKIILFLINASIEIGFFLVTGFIRIFSTILSLAIDFAKAFVNIILTPIQVLLDALRNVAAFLGIKLNVPDIKNIVNPVFDSMSGMISGFGQGLADEITKAKDTFMSGIGLGANLGTSFNNIDRNVDFAVDSIIININGNVDENNAKTVAQESGRAIASDLFSFYNRGVSPSGSQ